MHIARRFTREGVGPYEGIDFEQRIAKVVTREGATVGTEIPVTVPSSWSQTASEMLATKYLRRAGVPNLRLRQPEDGVPEWLHRHQPYMEATLGSEDDCRQVFHRIAGCYTYHGWKAGYFDAETDARAFYDEIVWMLAHQMAAPNSPVWFSAGLHWAYGITGDKQGHWHFDAEGVSHESYDAYSHPVCSACFIQPLEDTLLGENGITSFVEREARVFKMGSGSGSNVSNIRGEKEPLSGGGTSSGLMSWLPIFDRNAAAIKSAGTTRRAARAIILDVDHPDIEEFVGWKNREEFKVAALVVGAKVLQRHVSAILKAFHASDVPKLIRAKKAAKKDGVPNNVVVDTIHLGHSGVTEIRFPTFDTDYENEAYTTVSGQNANNSISVTNAFMNAVEACSEWALKSRTGKIPDKKIPAKRLWNQIVHSAWGCADPGLYFDDTINEWHTCIADGRIRGANPCQPALAKLMTPEGVRPMQNVEVGSFVWSGKRWATVTAKHSNGIQEVFAYRTGAGSFIGTKTHKVYQNGIAIPVGEATGIDRCFSEPQGGDGPVPQPLRIEAVEHLGPMPVFDIETDGENCYWTDGLKASNCFEFLFLDETACVLSCLNLMKFHDEATGKFDDESFRHASRLWTIALDISVGMSQYPSRGIAEGMCKYRTIGLGYCNIGALLMANGLPYDSDDGRAMAAAVTAIMHFQAYTTSAEIAEHLGAFPRYEANRDGVLRVLKNHAVCSGAIIRSELIGVSIAPPMPVADRGENGEKDEISRLSIAARIAGSSTFLHAHRYGVRNAQVSVVQPGGTVGLLMDSSTLGIEPDFSLVKHKKLAGGGYLKLVNQTVPITLRRLGYSEEDVAAICEAVETTGTVETSPLLKPEHLAVFDCAVRCGPQSKRSIRPLAHVEMVAAIQPFLAGGVSKTINMPNDATEADVEEVFMAAWKLGVKAIPVYRDGSKLSQPLTTVGEEPEDIEDILADPETTAQKVVEKVLIKHALARRDLPTKRKGYTQKARIGDHKVYVRTGEYEDGTLGEIWIDMHKEGAAFRAMANALAMAVSIALQHGTPLEEFVEAFCFMKFEPNGVVQGNDRIRNCTSVVDYIFRELAVNYLGRDDLAHAPAIIAPGTTDTGPKPDTDSVVEFIAIGRIEAKSMGYEGDACRNCGNFTLVRSGTCCVCKSCGETSGCS